MRLRLNQEYRNKIANRMRVHIEAEHTQEREKYHRRSYISLSKPGTLV